MVREINKKQLADIAVAKTVCDLTEKGYLTFTPIVSENLRFDLVAYKDDTFFKIQCKYSSDGLIRNKTTWSNRSGNHINKYSEGDFDYYSVYIPEKNVICYPSFEFGGCTIATKLPNSATKFYWYEDFLEFTNKATKKTYKDFGYELTGQKSPRINCRKVKRPSKEELEKLLWSKPMTELAKDFGVSDKAISKWAKYYNIKKPPIGHWLSKTSTKC